MVEYVVGVGGRVVVADDAGVLRLTRLVHVAAHREPGGAVLLLVLHLQHSNNNIDREQWAKRFSAVSVPVSMLHLMGCWAARSAAGRHT